MYTKYYVTVTLGWHDSKQAETKIDVYIQKSWLGGTWEPYAPFPEVILASHEGKSINLLCEEFTSALQSGNEQYVLQHTISAKPSVPWMPQEIKRTIRKRDSLYDKYNRLRRLTDRCAILEAKHLVKLKLKLMTGILRKSWVLLIAEQPEPNCQSSPVPHKRTLSSKELFYLENSKQDSKGIAPSRRTVSCTLILWTGQTS